MSRTTNKMVVTEATNTSHISWVGIINDIKAKYNDSCTVLLPPGIVETILK